MNRGLFGCAATGLIMFVSVGCEIAEAGEAADDNERGFYAGAAVTRAEQDVHGEGLMVVSISPPFGFGALLLPDRVEIDDTSTGWNVTLGYRFNEYLAAELSYYDFGTASVTERYFPRLVGFPAEITTRSELQTYGPGVAVLGSLPVTKTVNVFARGGVLFADRESVTRHGTFPIKHRTGDEIWIGGVGAQWAFVPSWTARLEYQVSESIDEDRTVRAGTTKVKQASLSVLFDF